MTEQKFKIVEVFNNDNPDIKVVLNSMFKSYILGIINNKDLNNEEISV